MANPSLKLSAQQRGGFLSIDIEDITGTYNATTNTTGWNAPNNSIGDALTATLTVYLPDPATGLPLATAGVTAISAFPTLPNTIGTTFNLTNAQLGEASTKILPDGIYRIVYTVTGNNALSTVVDSLVYMDRKAEFYLDKLLATVSVEGCDCGGLSGNLTSAKIAEKFILWKGARAQAACGKTNKAALTILHLDEFFDCTFDDYTRN